MASLENRGNGHWRIVVSNGYAPSGRQRKITKTIHLPPTMTINAQRREAAKQAAALETDAGRNLVTDARKVSLDELFSLYCDAKSETLATSTLHHYQYLYNGKIRDTLGNVAAQDCTPRRLQKWFSDLGKQPAGARSKNGKLSGNSRHHYYALLRALFGYAVQLQILAVSPMDAVTPPPIDADETQFLEPADLARLLDCLQNEPIIWRCFFTLAIFTGCRPAELVGLDWADLDGHTLTISAGATRRNGQTVRTERPKTKSSIRKIDLPDECLDVLTIWSVEQADFKAKFGKGWIAGDAIFTSTKGTRMDLSSPTQRFQKILIKYDLPKVPLYALRHSHASALIQAGLDPKTVSARLGHSQVSTTLNTYTHEFMTANSMATQAITQAISTAREAQKTGYNPQIIPKTENNAYNFRNAKPLKT